MQQPKKTIDEKDKLPEPPKPTNEKDESVLDKVEDALENNVDVTESSVSVKIPL